MKLSKREMLLIKSILESKRQYRNTNIPLRATVWEPFMEDLLTKINDEHEVLT